VAARQQPVEILRLHLCDGDRYRGRPLHEAIVDKCREMRIAGATVLRGLEGYGETGDLHGHHLTGHGDPLVIVVVDTPEQIAALAPVVESMMNTGVIARSSAEAIRVEKADPSRLRTRSPV